MALIHLSLTLSSWCAMHMLFHVQYMAFKCSLPPLPGGISPDIQDKPVVCPDQPVIIYSMTQQCLHKPLGHCVCFMVPWLHRGMQIVCTCT